MAEKRAPPTAQIERENAAGPGRRRAQRRKEESHIQASPTCPRDQDSRKKRTGGPRPESASHQNAKERKGALRTRKGRGTLKRGRTPKVAQVGGAMTDTRWQAGGKLVDRSQGRS